MRETALPPSSRPADPGVEKDRRRIGWVRSPLTAPQQGVPRRRLLMSMPRAVLGIVVDRSSAHAGRMRRRTAGRAQRGARRATAVESAPPPMLVPVPPPPPFDGVIWIGGYWGWQGRRVWCSGRWAAPPQPGCVWTQPYHEHRDGAVVSVAGFWRAPTVAFVPPPVRLNLEVTLGGVSGVQPIGPPGVFAPPPRARGPASWCRRRSAPRPPWWWVHHRSPTWGCGCQPTCR